MTSTSAPPQIELEAPDPASARRRTVWRAFWTSRLLVMVVGAAAVLNAGVASDAQELDPAGLTHPFGYFANLLVSPLARWDSVWYIAIAKTGYGGDFDRTAFFPLYPDLMRALGWVVRSQLLAGALISIACFAIALALLHRLVALDLPTPVADATVWLLAFFPTAFFFSAVYTESLFLALSLGCILQARRGRWLWCCVLGGLAAASRNGGLLLLVPVLILMLYGPCADGPGRCTRWAADRAGWRVLLPRYRIPPDGLYVVLIPFGLIAYLGFLQIKYGMASAPFHAEAAWYHKQTWPFGGVWQGIVAAWEGLRQILHGPPPPVYFKADGGPALFGASQDIEMFGFLILAAIALVGVARTLPFAYFAYTFLGLALPLSDPVSPQPLQSLPRYELMLFPIFIWWAAVVVRRGWMTPGIALSAALLGLFTAEFATWHFVA